MTNRRQALAALIGAPLAWLGWKRKPVTTIGTAKADANGWFFCNSNATTGPVHISGETLENWDNFPEIVYYTYITSDGRGAMKIGERNAS